jgi:hypothetical protein
MTATRRLAAILAAAIVGYSRLVYNGRGRGGEGSFCCGCGCPFCVLSVLLGTGPNIQKKSFVRSLIGGAAKLPLAGWLRANR